VRKCATASAQSFTLWQQATIEITYHDHSFIACSHRAHPVRGESHIQRNANGEFATLLIKFSRLMFSIFAYACEWGAGAI